jgi:hypothetical protein
MNFYVKYKGRRAETLTKYNNPALRNGPYDFSKGKTEVDEKDAEVLIIENPQAFENLGPVPMMAKLAEEKKPVVAAKAASLRHGTAPATKAK